MKRLIFIITFTVFLLVSCTQTDKPNEIVSEKPFKDSFTLKAEVLAVSTESAQLTILELISYAPDPRDNTIKLQEGDVKEFIFQWGTLEREVDLSPIGESDSDISLPGIKVGDIILADGDIDEKKQVIYSYEIIS